MPRVDPRCHLGVGGEARVSWAFLASHMSSSDLVKLLEQLCSGKRPRGQAELQMQSSMDIFPKSQQMGEMFGSWIIPSTKRT